MGVTLDSAALAPYEHFSLYNSPYRAHDKGCAIDLYPPSCRIPATGAGIVARSPVAGTVADIRSVGAPSRPGTADRDHLVVVDRGETVARLLHVDPGVGVGDRVAVGDRLGRLIRSGYFDPWVGNHLHLEIRPAGRDPHRASGSLPIEPPVAVDPVAWDGTGTVVATGESYAILDDPRHPSPGRAFAALAADGGHPLDGGLVHYPHGGLLGEAPARRSTPPTVSLLGSDVGRVEDRAVHWADVTVRANGVAVTGLSLVASRTDLGVKVICPDMTLAEGADVTVTIEA